MVKSGTLDRTFAALSDPTRRGILAVLAGGPRTVGELAAPFAMSLVAVSKHISVLERAGLITRTKTGRTQVCALTAAPLGDAAGWLDHYRDFWATRLDALEHYLDTEDR